MKETKRYPWIAVVMRPDQYKKFRHKCDTTKILRKNGLKDTLGYSTAINKLIDMWLEGSIELDTKNSA